MTLSYPTAVTSSIFLNGYHIDQAYRIDWRQSSPKVPIYGYNDYYFSNVAHGKIAIQGMLIINFVYPAYLTPVIKNSLGVTGPDRDKVNLSLREEFSTSLPDINTTEGRSARAELIASLLVTKKKENKQQVVKALTEHFNLEPRGRDSNNIESVQSPGEVLQPQGSTLDIYYYDPGTSLWYVSFKNVYFTDVSQQISNAGAEGSSEPLYEIYEFIASKREIKHLRNPR